MSKRKKTKKHPHPRHSYRNAAPRAPRAPARKPQEEETPLRRLAYTAAGAGSTALAGSILLREGWAPKTIATALTAVGAGLAWKGDAPTVRSIGAGVMSAAGSQLAILTIEDHEKKSAPGAQDDQTAPNTQSARKLSNAAGLPPGSLSSALDRARSRLRLAARAQEAMA
jgi:hypothetical protein